MPIYKPETLRGSTVSDSSAKRSEKFVAWVQASRHSPERPAKPFEKMWLYGHIVCMAALVALYAYSPNDWDPNVPGGAWRITALALFIGSIGSYSIYTGEVSFKGMVCVRSVSPVAFGVLVAMLFLMSFGVFLLGMGSLTP